jgi:hypothetical protein
MRDDNRVSRAIVHEYYTQILVTHTMESGPITGHWFNPRHPAGI